MRKKILVVMLSVSLSLTLVACSGSDNGSNSSDSGKIKIVSSISNWGSLAKDVGGDMVNVINVIEGSNSPSHEFEPTAQQIDEFSSANYIIVNGADYDNWAVQAAKNAVDGNSGIQVLNIAEMLKVKKDANPHLWNNTEYIVNVQDKIYEYLKSVLQGDDLDTLETNHSATKDKLYALNEKLAEIYRAKKGTTYVKTESILDYLMENGLSFKDATPDSYKNAVQNGSEPPASAISDMENVIKTGGASYLIVNEQEKPSYVSAVIDTAKEQKDVKIISITELMPSNFTDIYDWLSDTVSVIDKN
jgi:zinc/manganese transport system substrate-binding protein